MKRIIVLLFVLITAHSFLYAQTVQSVDKQVEEQVENKFLTMGLPLRYYSNVLIKLQGNPTKEDSLIFKELVDTLNVLIDKWDVYLISEGTSNLLVYLNDSTKKNETNHFREESEHPWELVQRELILNIPQDLDHDLRKKIIYYHLLRSMVTFKAGNYKSKVIQGSIFSEKLPQNIEFLPLDFKIIKKLYSKEYEDKPRSIVKKTSYNFRFLSFSILLNLLALIISFSFLIFLSIKGKFNSHNYQFKAFLNQGFWVVLACIFYLVVGGSISIDPINENIIIFIGSLFSFFAIAFLAICFVFVLERFILKRTNNFAIQILIPFFSLTLIPLALSILFSYINLKIEKPFISILLSMVIYYTLIIGFLRSIYIYTRIKSENIIRKKDVELAQMSELQKQAELQSLQAKINPHFLYNALNSIASLAATDAIKTEQMALALSDFFKYAINREQKQLNTLSEELNAISTYLEIEKVRFGDRLNYEIDCDPKLLEIQVPQLLIQPLVENAIKHGLSQITENGRIRILIRQADQQVKIRVYDNGPVFPEGPLSGFGIRNTQERIALLYGEHAKVNWQNGIEKYIEIAIPFVPEPVKKD